MFKWLLLFLGIGVFYLWFKGKKQAKINPKNQVKPNASKAPASLKPEAMVQCRYCKVHLPQPEAVVNDGRFYCSSEHLQALDEQGWIGAATWRTSPNQDVRSDNMEPDLLVVHHISLPPGEYKSQDSSRHIVDFFQNRLDPSAHPYFAEIADQKVSSHFLITRTGELIQFVPTQNRAWHAGSSSFMGREKCNDFSIGVELEGDGETPFTEIQYKSFAQLVKKLLSSYPNLQFAGHSDIAPGRKTDPGKYFDWAKFQKETSISPEKMPYGMVSR